MPLGLPGPSEIQTMDYPNGLSIGLDVEAFDEAIRAHGVELVHYRGMRDPTGLVDLGDTRRPEGTAPTSSNGMIYTEAGTLTGLVTSNSKDLRRSEGGLLDSGIAQLTAPRNYDNTAEPIYLHPMDRLYLKETSVLVTHQQLVENHISGRDRLRFPVTQVLDLVDARGIRYKAGADFQIAPSGDLVWGSRRPGESEAGKGLVYAVRYLYRPFFYVDSLIHDLRIVQQEDPVTGQRRTVRMPQTAKIAREYVYRTDPTDLDRPITPRSAPAPESGQFGDR